MRELLEAVAAGEVTPREAESRLVGYATTDAGRFDADRTDRTGVPEAIYGAGKTAAEIATLSAAAVETTGHALVTRIDEAAVDAVADAVPEGATLDRDTRARTLVVHGAGFEPPRVDATVGVVTAGTADAAAAGEAAVVVREMGPSVDRVHDVGVAHLGRVLDQRDRLEAADVLVVAAGREGALPTVVSGLVDTPVVGLPVASGYGFRGDGEAALAGMLQSCTVLSVVNVDAGFVAGAQAARIARAIAD